MQVENEKDEERQPRQILTRIQVKNYEFSEFEQRQYTRLILKFPSLRQIPYDKFMQSLKYDINEPI